MLDADKLWVLDTGNNRVVQMTTGGTTQGGAITELNQPYGLAQDDDRLYVANTYDHDVRAYDKSDRDTGVGPDHL